MPRRRDHRRTPTDRHSGRLEEPLIDLFVFFADIAFADHWRRSLARDMPHAAPARYHSAVPSLTRYGTTRSRVNGLPRLLGLARSGVSTHQTYSRTSPPANSHGVR